MAHKFGFYCSLNLRQIQVLSEYAKLLELQTGQAFTRNETIPYFIDKDITPKVKAALAKLEAERKQNAGKDEPAKEGGD